jgi:hypothetical protein
LLVAVALESGPFCVADDKGKPAKKGWAIEGRKEKERKKQQKIFSVGTLRQKQTSFFLHHEER